MEIGNSSKPHLYQTGNLHGNSPRESPWKHQMECLWRSNEIPMGNPNWNPPQGVAMGNPHGEGKSPQGHGAHGESPWESSQDMGNPHRYRFPVGTLTLDRGIGRNSAQISARPKHFCLGRAGLRQLKTPDLGFDPGIFAWLESQA